MEGIGPCLSNQLGPAADDSPQLRADAIWIKDAAFVNFDSDVGNNQAMPVLIACRLEPFEALSFT